MDFVVDRSVTMAWWFVEESNPFTEAVLDRLKSTEAAVPAIWPMEVANILLACERRRQITEAQTMRFVEILQSLPITVDSEALTGALGPVLMLGRQYGLSANDAAYLELAAREHLPLATQDARLRAAAVRLGVQLLEL